MICCLELFRPWPQAQKDHQRLPDKDISQSQRNISGKLQLHITFNIFYFLIDKYDKGGFLT